MMGEPKNALYGKPEPERIYYKTISAKTKAWINKRPFMTRLSYIDPDTKVPVWFGMRLSEKLIEHVDPKKKNLDLLMNAP